MMTSQVTWSSLVLSAALIAWLTVVVADAAAVHAISNGRVVRTKDGALRGIVLPTPVPPNGSRIKYGNVEAFLGIPYAAPPVGPLRYLPPASPGPWTGTRLASAVGPACPQQLPHLTNRTAALQSLPRSRYFQLRRMQLLLANQSEDCLYLNVYVPPEAVNGKMAVTVLIHGESYSWGAGHLIDGGLLAAKSRLIVVTLNFRLGVLGFLQTAAMPTPGQARGKSRDAIATQGNYGLLDMVAALLWIKNNIATFGGDADRVTLAGHGTGAALVNLLMISPLATGLFSRALLMAGSALSPASLAADPRSVKEQVARQMECRESPSPDADIGDCLRKKPLASLLSIQLETPRFWPGFAPFIDGYIVPVDPLVAMQSTSNNFHNYPLMAGVTSLESYRFISDADLRTGITEDRRDRILRTLVRNVFHYHLNEIYHVLRNEYTDWDRSAVDAFSMRDSMTASLSDGLAVAPLVHVLHLHAARAPAEHTYFYHYAQIYEEDEADYHHMGSVTGDEFEALQLDATTNGQKGVPTQVNSSRPTEGNVSLEDQFLQYIVCFSNTGDPNVAIGSKGELMPRTQLRWDPFDKHSQNYMVFGGRPHIKSHYRGHYMSVWLQLIPQLHQPGPGQVIVAHHQFDHAVETAFYEGVVRPSQPTGILNNGSLGSGGSGLRTSISMAECVATRNDTHNSSTGIDWPPNVMASEGMAGGSASSGSGSPTSTGSGGTVASLTNNTALSITLIVGLFFLALNLLLFGAIYRQRMNHHRSSKKQRAGSRDTTEVMESSVTDLRQLTGPDSRLSKSRSSFTVDTPVAAVNGGIGVGLDVIGAFKPSHSSSSSVMMMLPPQPPSPPLVYREPFHLSQLEFADHHTAIHGGTTTKSAATCAKWPAATSTASASAASSAVKKAQVQEITV